MSRVVSVGADMRRVLGFCLLLFGMTGCGGTLYAINASSASAQLEEAKEVGAEELAPYEYYYAKAHLDQAQIEASSASYSDAILYAETAEEYADKAIELSKAARAAGGRK
jgi:hypothetical protein